MPTNREGQVNEIPISQRIITEQSQTTIRTLADALVELVTNSDDSYRRQELATSPADGHIEIYVHRQRAGRVAEIRVSDWAEGMSLDRILEVLEFGADSSGFTSGANLRGLFGKGLKEAIFALGTGRVESVYDGRISAVDIWWDSDSASYRSRVDLDERPSDAPNGTEVSVAVSNDRITSPTWIHLCKLVRTHFALRDICASSARHVRLILKDRDVTRSLELHYELPTVISTTERTIEVAGLGEVLLTIGESEHPLEYTSRDPCSIAGLVVSTEGIPLENRAFGFENEIALRYFTGLVEVPAIAEAIRSNDLGLIDPSRAGLNWRDTRARKLQDAIEVELREQIDRKRRDLDADRRRAMSEQNRRQLREVCSLLNRLAEDEIEDIPPYGPSGGRLEGLAMRPEVGNARPGELRRFNVYLPARLVQSGDPRSVAISTEVGRGNIWLSRDLIELRPHPRDSEVLYGEFSVRGSQLGDSCMLFANWKDQDDISEFRVREPGTRTTTTTTRSRGLFREILFDDQESTPSQRVSFSHGEITIYLNFPPIQNYLGPGGQGMGSPKGSLMCAELVAEAFGREIARRRIDQGLVVPVMGGEIDAYNSELNNLLRKYLEQVHRAFVEGEST